MNASGLFPNEMTSPFGCTRHNLCQGYHNYQHLVANTSSTMIHTITRIQLNKNKMFI